MVSKRNSQARMRNIMERLRKVGEVSVDQLALALETSEVTVRKDLANLEARGLLIRRFGGAILPPGASNAAASNGAQQGTKRQIAEAAAQLIDPSGRIVIDSGRTTAQLAPLIKHLSGLVVMTNSLAVAAPLTETENGPTTLMPGGTWDKKTQSFQGHVSEQLLRAYDFDQLFVGADGIDLQRGTTTFNELLNLSRVMAEISSQVIVMAESVKIGRKIPNLELAWSQIDVFVTDSNLSPSAKQTIEELNVNVVIA